MAVNRLGLDTSGHSQFERGHSVAVEAVIQASEVLVPAVVVGELPSVFRPGSRAAQNENEPEEFLRHRGVDSNQEVAKVYAALVVALRRAGTPVPTNDIWIGAIAAREGATVLTFDEDFTRLQRVAVQLAMP